MVLFNWITYLILAATIANWAIDIVSKLLNIHQLKEDVPLEFIDVYDKDAYKKSQQYTRSKATFGIWSESYSTAIFLILWFGRFINLVDIQVRTVLSDFSSIVHGLVFLFSLNIIIMMLTLPFDIYATFILEETFGFNKTTFRTFVMDKIKGLSLAVILGGPLLAAILWFLQFAGPSAWLYCWFAVTAFTLLMQLISPKYLLPLFNTLTPLSDESLRHRIADLAEKVKFSFGDIFLMDGSKRSNHSNAFFAGFGPTKRIVLFDTLVENHSVEELLAILGHEMGHYQMGHIYMMMLQSVVHTFVLFYTMQFFVSNKTLFEAFFIDSQSYYLGLYLFTQMLAPVETVLQMVLSAMSRRNEYEADRFAVDCIPDSNELISGLKKLSLKNLANLTPHWFIVLLSYSHPPVMERIEAIRSYANNRKSD